MRRVLVHFIRYIIFCPELRVAQRLLLDGFRQLRQTLFPCNGGPRAALWAIGAVDILRFGQRFRRIQRLLQLCAQHPLLAQCLGDFALAFFQLTQIFQSLAQQTQHLVIHGTRALLAVARNKRNGASLINQLYDIFDIFRLQVHFLRQHFHNIQSESPPRLFSKLL